MTEKRYVFNDPHDLTIKEADEREIFSAPDGTHVSTFQSPMVETIDITPRGCMTMEGTERVNAAVGEFATSTGALAEAATTFFETWEDSIRGRFLGDASMCEDLHQIRALIGARNRKQEAVLKAVAGR